jgi:hypothetical protein
MCETEIFRNGDGMALETWAESWRWELQHATTNLNIWIWIHVMRIHEIWSNKMDRGEALRPVDSRWSCHVSSASCSGVLSVFPVDPYPIPWKWTGTWLDELVFAASFQSSKVSISLSIFALDSQAMFLALLWQTMAPSPLTEKTQVPFPWKLRISAAYDASCGASGWNSLEKYLELPNICWFMLTISTHIAIVWNGKYVHIHDSSQ